MGQKANINSLHLSDKKDWNCLWYSNEKEYSKILSEDLMILNYLKSCYGLNNESEILKIRLCRVSRSIVINLQLTSGLKSESSMLLKDMVVNLKRIFLNFDRVFVVSKVLELNELKVEPIYLSRKIGRLIENRIRFKSYLIKSLVNQTFEVCNGVKVLCKGRLNGVDMAGCDFLSLGSIPFQTLDAKIDYGFSVANTPKGLQSIKVWFYK